MVSSAPLDILPLSAALIAARRARTRMSGATMPLPLDRAEAMRAQGEVARAFGATGGWKVGSTPDGAATYAPLFGLTTAGTRLPYPDGCLLEVEIGVRLGADLPPRPDKPYDRAEVLAAIDMVFLGVEVVASRYVEGSRVPFLLWLADALGNDAYVTGEELPRAILDRYGDFECQLTIDGLSLHEAPAVHPNGDPLHPLVAALNDQSDGLGGFRAGQFVTTGSLCGGIPCTAPGEVEAMLGETRLTFTLG